MTAGTWYADVDFIAATPISLDEAETILDTLAERGGALSLSADGLAGGVSIALDTTDAVAASREAAEVTVEAFASHDLTVVKIDVRREDVADAELGAPVIPPLVGYAEIADMAGVSRQRARQFAAISSFPTPVVETASGPLRLRSSIEAWLATRNTRPGRPRESATA